MPFVGVLSLLSLCLSLSLLFSAYILRVDTNPLPAAFISVSFPLLDGISTPSAHVHTSVVLQSQFQGSNIALKDCYGGPTNTQQFVHHNTRQTPDLTTTGTLSRNSHDTLQHGKKHTKRACSSRGAKKNLTAMAQLKKKPAG